MAEYPTHGQNADGLAPWDGMLRVYIDEGDTNNAIAVIEEANRAVAAEANLLNLIGGAVASTFPIVFSKAGFMTVGPLHGGWLVPAGGFNFASASVLLITPPVGAAAIFDVFLDGLSLWHLNPSRRPSVAAGAQVAHSGLPDILTATTDSIVTASCVQTGSPTTEGVDLTLTVLTTF